MDDPHGGIQPPIHLWWDMPSDDAGPWWVLPGTGAPIFVRRSDGLMALVPAQGTERFMLEQRMLRGDTPLRVGDTVVWVDADVDGGIRLRYPQRVVAVLGEQSAIVWTLVDVKLEGDFDAWDEDEAAAEAWISRGFVLHREQRALLERFQLNVDCPSCGTPGQQVVVGMPSGLPDPWLDLAGCVIQPGQPMGSYRCIR